MKRLLTWLTCVVFTLPCLASTVSLHVQFRDVARCNFPGFYYAPWAPPIHPYFVERRLTPYKEQDGLFYFRVSDTLFGLPVAELIVPGTWDYHMVRFDATAPQVRQTLKKRFGTEFAETAASKRGERPFVSVYNEDGRTWVSFGCSERTGGQ